MASLAGRVYALEGGPRALPLSPRTEQPAMARPSTDLPLPSTASLETKLGTYWLSRLGIVSLITGVALLVVTHFDELGSVSRVALGYAMAAVIAFIGIRLSARHLTFGRVVFAGGLAIGYFATYALHFVPSMRVIESELVGTALTGFAIAGIVAVAHRMKSETVAGVALFLGLHTGMLSEATQLSLVVTTLLAGGAAFFLAANRWVIVPLSTVVAVYMTHASLALSAQPAVEPSTTLAFLAIDFGLFSLAWLIRPNQRTLLLPIVALNWFGLVALGARVLIPMSQDTAFTFLCSAALVHAALAGLARLRGAPASLVALLLGLAIATAGIALPVNLHGWLLVGGWIFLAFGAAAAARSRATWGGFSGIAIVLLTIATAEAVLKLEDPAAIAICLAAWVAVERGHAPSNRLTESRWLLVAGATLTLAALGRQVVPPEGHAIAGVVAALILFATGFALTARAYRWAAFATLAIAAARFLTVQLAQLSATSKIATFATAGVILLAVSYAYTRVSAKR